MPDERKAQVPKFPWARGGRLYEDHSAYNANEPLDAYEVCSKAMDHQFGESTLIAHGCHDNGDHIAMIATITALGHEYECIGRAGSYQVRSDYRIAFMVAEQVSDAIFKALGEE